MSTVTDAPRRDPAQDGEPLDVDREADAAVEPLDGAPPAAMPPPPWLDATIARNLLSGAIVFACCAFVLWVCQPHWVLTNTTPTGGDMGAHVWGPAYLRDHLLPNFRVTGWTPDWYSGFPAYTFYMVLPSLAIVALDVGILPWWAGIVVFPASLAAAWWVWQRVRIRAVRYVATAAPVLAAVLLVDIHYNIAFKLVAISGVVLFPAGVWWFGKGLDLRTPGPEIMAIASVFFLADKDLFSIYGGNIASTMAGEFAFSISLTAAMFFLGTAARGMKTGRHRALGAVLFAVTALCHVIPTIFAVVACVLLVVVQPRFRSMGRALRWVVPTGAVGGLIAAFWYGPFYGNSAYLNDMGWEKLGRLTCDGKTFELRREFLRYLLPFAPHQTGCPPGITPSDDPNMWGGKVFFVLAVIGVVLSLAFLVRAGIYLTLLTGITAVGFWLMPQARFWNARILPFYYLCIYLLAGIGLWLVLKTIWLLVTGRWTDPPIWFSASVAGSVAVVSYLILAMLMHSLPFGSTLVSSEAGKAIPAGQPVYGWGCTTDNGAQATADDCLWTTASTNPVRGWSEWNFRGLELKGNINAVTGVSDLKDWKEYKGIVDEMARIGADLGCGRSFWEFDSGQNKYGSTMAMMLLPYWTHSCIGSEEGLYFEASSTTPFHFLIQSELSDKPSRPMRMDEHVGFETGDPSPYSPVNVSQGVSHLQMLGIKYFLTYSKTVDALAQKEPRLTRIGGSGPWTVYQVADAPLVVGLANKPAVWTDVNDDIHDWVKPSIDWFNDPTRWAVMPATSGPADWPRVSRNDTSPAPEVATTVANVSNLTVYRDSMSFDVDKVGTPVLVRTSFFPNWEVTGASGPYRVGPNMMVVVPTSTHVEMNYGRSSIEWGGWALTFVGILLAFWLARKERWLVEEDLVFPGDRNDDPNRMRTEMIEFASVDGSSGQPATEQSDAGLLLDDPVPPEPFPDGPVPPEPSVGPAPSP